MKIHVVWILFAHGASGRICSIIEKLLVLQPLMRG